MIETGDSFSRLSLEKSVELLGRQETPPAVGVVGALAEHVWPTGGAPKGKPQASGDLVTCSRL